MNPFEAKNTITEAVNRVLKVLANYKKGDTVVWAAIEGAAGFERYSRHWSAFFRRLKRDFLRQSGVCLWPEPSVGMRLLTNQESLTMRAAARRRRAFRQMRRDEQELNAIPNSELTTTQKLLKANQIEAARTAKRQVLRQLRIGHTLAKPTPTLPRIPIPMAKKSA